MNTLVIETKEKLKEIADYILDYEEDDSIGLLTGYAGMMLFLFHYGRYVEEEKYTHKAVSFLYKSMDLINEGKCDLSYSIGISGFGWALEHLAEKEFIDKVDVLYQLDDKICEYMLEQTSEGNWDALHGGIGAAFYLFYRQINPSVITALEKVVELLKDQAIEDENGLKWITENRTKQETNINFGLAHGIPSIIVFLKKCIENNINKDLATEMLKKAVQFVLSNKYAAEQSANVYPMAIMEEKILKSNRLAWCYGDPGILLSLIHANKVLKSLKEEIKELTKLTLDRLELKENGLNDACMCHGTAGMIPMLLSMHSDSELKKLIPQSILNLWVKETLKFGNHPEGLVGFRNFFIINYKPNWSNVSGFLDGVTGIGFCLLSYLNADITWSQCIMIK